jgi:Malectin domain
MKSILLVLLMATNVIAFKQIFAINAGGEAHTDSDGIAYQRRVEKHGRGQYLFNTGNVPDKDKLIYHTYEYSIKPVQLQYDIPFKNDGLYLLLAKFATHDDTREIDITLNGKIKLLSNVDMRGLCGGSLQTCDVYLYFCVTDGTLYYQNQSTLLQNEIHVEIRPIAHGVMISGLILLEGSPGERQKLVSSNTNELLDFDQTKMHSRCTTTKTVRRPSLESNQNGTANFCEINLNNITELLSQQFPKIQTDVMSSIEQAQIEFIMQQNQSTGRMDIKLERLQLEMTTKIDQTNTNIEKLHNQSTEQMNKLQSELATKADQTNKNYEKLQADVQQLAEIQQKSDERQAAMKTSIERNQESSNQIHNSQTELTSKSNQANKNIEALQVSVQQLVEDNQKMRAEIKQLNLDSKAEQVNLNAAISEITKQLSVISDVVMTIEERQK